MNDHEEVAQTLREFKHKTYYKEEIVENICDAISIADPTNTFCEPEDIYELLADIIDPTCTDLTNGKNYDFACSACGHCSNVYQPNYCPHCRARVVYNNDDA